MNEQEQQEILTPEEKLKVFGDKLLASIIHSTELSKKNKTYVLGMFNSEVFKDENYLIYYTLYRFKDLKITPDEEFITLYLMNNPKILKDAGEKIDMNAFSEVGDEEDLLTTYVGVVKKHFTRLKGMPVLDYEEFKLTCEKYRLLVVSIEATKIYANANRIILTGAKIGRRNMMGYEDSKAYVTREFARIEALTTRNAGEGYVSMRGFQEEQDTKKITFVSTWGIRELDELYGGIYTSTFISIMAPPKNGKTKLCAQLVHRAAVLYGEPAVIWAIEGGRKAFDAQLRAKHFDYVYNRNITDVRQKKIGVDADIIKDDKFEDDQLRQLEEASKIDLYNNPNYGEIMYVELPCVVEDFIVKLDAAVQAIGAKIVVIDYLQLIGSDNKLGERERINDAYIAVLKYCNERNIVIISPAQYTQEMIKDISKNGTDGSADLRTGGGGSSQVVRTPDLNIALWATPEDLIRGDMSLLSIPSRMKKPFPRIDIKTELGCCNFFSKPEV